MLPPGAEFDLGNTSMEDRVRAIAAQTSFLEAVARKRSANLLLVGSISGFLGFMFAFVIGIVAEQTEGRTNIDGVPFKSGRSYFPSTVSEMVHDPEKPEGKVFFAFCFVGAVMIFLSWYPMQLRNVYIGDDAELCGISWVTIRQFVPAPGMMMLSIITTVPAAKASITDDFCITLHLLGAAMLFVGYFVCEAHAIGWGPFSGCLEEGKLNDSRTSIRQRKWCLTGIGLFYTIFCVVQVVLCTPLIDHSEDDQWGPLPGHEGVFLVNSATWHVKWLKVLSYGSEVICGLLLIGSHLILWYHCEERFYDLPETLAALHSRMNIESDGDSEGSGSDSG